MSVRRWGSGLRELTLHTALPTLVAVALAGAGVDALSARAGARTTAHQISAGPQIELVGPSHASVGQVVSYRLIARNAAGIGAFQADLRYDDTALGVVRVRS